MFDQNNELGKRLCDECGKNAAVYYTQTVKNGVASERYLCEECKKKHGFIKSDLPDFGTILAAFGNPFHGIVGKQPVAKVCPTCGYSSGEYLDTGFLGCPDCYKAFEGIVNSSLVKLQKDVKHTGKSPKEFYSPEEAKYNDLLRQREEAVAKEDFMLAAKINEQMLKLKGGAQ